MDKTEKMATASTEEIMRWSLELAGLDEIPPDSATYIPGENIHRILFGIDVASADLLLGRELGVDLVIAHHPADRLVGFPKIFSRHVDLMVAHGVPQKEAEEAIRTLTDRWTDRFHSANYDHVVSVARLLKMPFMNIHNALDEYGRQRMVQAVSELGTEATVKDVVAALTEIPEIASAPTQVQVAVGEPDNPAGRVAIVHGAGTNGGYEIAQTYFRHGIGTVVYIHLANDAKWRLRKESQGNVVVIGHLPGDLTGIQPFVQLMRDKGLEVIGFSGVR
ncbi:Putative GTP cyclohydrolase 1 type 2, NIF3 family [Sulfobacillus thermosulfidooxidans DSM 9293]|uniref:Putative GTP cyclohydrolase 1 type 2, NIF3 family n=1 Tax=Sulfobacillus thermosulfidooxidans (strain DSM 9293 / VKM B-1269 / AT-1) TaxID=929705 RepID=A0A1W1W822_SULTA|nr:hypothetical protein [Sulfobacillus thermosulfidooxidans]SMC02428.1 Putative GTP cyclohydrolase 1 type 2, NIF3 family [Sulfobacillus thermosulfidooxidans DSM 9293]